MKQIHPKSAKAWRAWLERNHDKEKSVSLVKYKKHTGKPTISYQEAMDEAICFGWIDTTIKRLDDDRYSRNFARRSKNSRWSKNTVSHAKRLIKEGRMSPAGLRAYKDGLKRPLLGHDIPDNPEPPEELVKLLSKSKKAKSFFDSLAPSYKRMTLRWLLSAKLPETKKKRMKLIYDACKEGKKIW